jgi:glycine/D-amino acid oxidase-like deaminating enzyme
MQNEALRQLAGLGAPHSLWEATAVETFTSTPLRGRVAADVAVVGGGITGLSTAIHLAERGVKVVVLEARQVAYGASGRNGGQVIPGLKRDPDDLIASFGAEAAEPMIRFAGTAADVVFGLVARYRIDCDAFRGGWIQAAHDEAARRTVVDRTRQWQARGADVAALSAEEMAKISGTSGYYGGWIDRRAGRLQPLDYTRGLARAAAGLGAVIHENSAVSAIAPADGKWRLTTTEGEVRAEKVVLCMNGYARDAWPKLERSYIPVSTFQIASEPLPERLRQTILKGNLAVSETHPLLHYFRWDAFGRLVMGGPGSLRPLTRASQVEHLLEGVERIFPQLTGLYRPAYFWGGDVAVTLDHLPHLHDLGSGVLAYYGCNGRGVALASAMGGLLAKAATGAARHELPFRFSAMSPVPFHAAYPLYIQVATTCYLLREHFKRPRAVFGASAAQQ